MSKEVINVSVNVLKPHPRNNEFFDDMVGEKWEEFLQSIKIRLDEYNSGEKDVKPIIEPIIVTTDMIIVSGHQRIRACKELGISTVDCEIRKYHSKDDILKDLIEINIRQRGDIGGSAKKTGKRIKELEKIYGIEHGGDRKSSTNNSVLKSQLERASQMRISVDTLQNYKMLADMIGISVDTLSNYKKLTELVPELQDWVETGILAPTTAI